MNAHTEFKAPAKLRALREIVEEYDQKNAAADEAVKAFDQAVTDCAMAANIGGTYGGSIWDRGSPSAYALTIRRVLLKSAWKHVYEGLNIATVATAKDRKNFELAFENPAPFTLDNIRATFGKYLVDPRHHMLRGLAEVFVDLDPVYKSHSKMKIGVKGLPKRIILSGVCNRWSYDSYGQNKLRDTINAIHTIRGLPHLTFREWQGMIDEAQKHGEADWIGGRVKGFMNGNAHLIFDEQTLLEVNRLLAEFYGEVLPDCEDEDSDDRDLFRQPSTEVSKDLQFYWTPDAVIREILHHLPERREQEISILEPSCGDGRIMDGIRAWATDPKEAWRRGRVRLTGIEVHPGRAEEARAKGHAVMTANFLEVAPDSRFDVVVMNPPFYGLHWKKHLDHAMKFLRAPEPGKPWTGGFVICVLPATACYDGHLLTYGIKSDAGNTYRMRDQGWYDLPVASFSESGTNVPTGYLVKGVARC